LILSGLSVLLFIDYHTTRKYFKEFARVMQPGTTTAIHQPSRHHSTLWPGFLRHLGEPGKQLYKLISMHAL
jgi:hypothetical protein